MVKAVPSPDKSVLSSSFPRNPAHPLASYEVVLDHVTTCHCREHKEWRSFILGGIRLPLFRREGVRSAGGNSVVCYWYLYVCVCWSRWSLYVCVW